jgi:hypothetical protein
MFLDIFVVEGIHTRDDWSIGKCFYNTSQLAITDIKVYYRSSFNRDTSLNNLPDFSEITDCLPRNIDYLSYLAETANCLIDLADS